MGHSEFDPQSGKGGRGTPDAWLARSVRSSRSRFGRSGSGSIENGVFATGHVSTGDHSKLRGCDIVKIRIGELVAAAG